MKKDCIQTMFALLCLATSVTANVDIFLNVYGFGNNLFASIATKKAIIEAYTNYVHGEKDALSNLLLNIATLALANVGGMAASSIIPYFENVVKKKVFTKTIQTMELHNLQLYEDAKDLLSAVRHQTMTDLKIKTKIQSSTVQLTKWRNQALQNFKTDLRAIKVKHPSLYKAIKSNTKWLRSGGRILKALGPLFDLISLGINSFVLHTSEPGTNAHTSAALGITGSVLGITGFLLGLVSVVFPPASVAAIAAGISSTVTTGAGITLGVSSAVVALLPEKENERNPDLEPNIAFGNILGVAHYNEKLETYVKNATSFLNKTGTYNWEYVYIMSQANVVEWEKVNNKIKVTGHNGKLESEAIDPMIDQKNSPLLHCLPYENILNVNGNKQTSNTLLNLECENTENGKVIGFDFVGSKNNFTAKDDTKFQGYIVICHTEAIRNDSIFLRGIEIDTESEGVEADHTNGNDLIILGDFEQIDDEERIIIRTGKGSDILSITGLIASRRIVEKKNGIDAYLGDGYNLLSFAAMQKSLGQLHYQDLYPISGYFHFIGIKYNAATSKIYYRFITGDDTNKKYVKQQLVGSIKGVRTLDCSPFNDEVILDVPLQKENYDGIEDLSVVNQSGENKYYITITDDEVNGRIRRFIIFDRSYQKPSIYIYALDQIKNRVTYKRDKKIVLFSKVGKDWRIFATIILLELRKSFSIFFNDEELNLPQVGVSFTKGIVDSYNIKANQPKPLFIENNDQVLLTCNNPNDLEGDNELILEMRGGDADSVVIGRKFFETCQVEPDTFEGDLSGVLGEDDQNEPSEVTLMMDTQTEMHVITITKNNSNIKKQIFLGNVERIVDDHGTTVVDLNAKLEGKTDLFQKYSDSFGSDVEAVGKIIRCFYYHLKKLS